jgi:diaminopimelate decarboxylase
VGKSRAELRRALEVGIRCFNLESEGELRRLGTEAEALGVVAPVSVRVNPDVDPETHPYITTGLKESKFGVDIEASEALYAEIAEHPWLAASGIDCHIGSQLTGLSPFLDALDRVLALAERLVAAGHAIHHLDLGGGLGVRYRDETPPEPAEWAGALLERLRGSPYEVLVEPGRAIVANAGVLLTRIEYLKHAEYKNFAVVDAAMNDLLRPALYGAWQEIVPAVERPDVQARVYDVVGPVCETGDFLGKERALAGTREAAVEIRRREVDHHALRTRGVVATLHQTAGRAHGALEHRKQGHMQGLRPLLAELDAEDVLVEGLGSGHVVDRDLEPTDGVVVRGHRVLLAGWARLQRAGRRDQESVSGEPSGSSASPARS